MMNNNYINPQTHTMIQHAELDSSLCVVTQLRPEFWPCFLLGLLGKFTSLLSNQSEAFGHCYQLRYTTTTTEAKSEAASQNIAGRGFHLRGSAGVSKGKTGRNKRGGSMAGYGTFSLAVLCKSDVM